MAACTSFDRQMIYKICNIVKKREREVEVEDNTNISEFSTIIAKQMFEQL